MRKWKAVGAFVAASCMAAVGLAGAGPADAQSPTGSTTVTFGITAGGLSITVPAAANLGSVAAGTASVSGQLGNVTVNDARGGLAKSWTTTVSSTDFTTGGATENETVPNDDVNYLAGLVTPGGINLPLPGLPANLAEPRTAATSTAGVGVTSATWNPTLTISLRPALVPGTYTGTVTHSVA